VRVALTLLPAVDVAGGRAVRPSPPDSGEPLVDLDPVEAALAWQRDGAQWLHLVDLDAAFNRGTNADLLGRIVGRLDIAVQLSGGIRDAGSLARALRTGAARVVLGTAALEHPDWCEQVIAAHGDRVAAGVDVRGRRLAARGGDHEGGDLAPTLEWLERAGCSRYVVTDVEKDGSMRGPNLDLLREVCARVRGSVIASGGVSTVDDLRALASLEPLGVAGVIAGRALYQGAFTVAQAVAVLRAG
jgi:1-(5-phosphoribosyl)-5-[(5-phosphoribosylamino)methylideneamino] imidazole-4-carboxamide isomerase/N-(5'phosphoribosyl)anthranilate isomerase